MARTEVFEKRLGRPQHRKNSDHLSWWWCLLGTSHIVRHWLQQMEPVCRSTHYYSGGNGATGGTHGGTHDKLRTNAPIANQPEAA